jgi:hypothetical protein
LLHRYFNLVLLAQLPLLGGVCALVFRDAQLTWPEHMVLVAYALGVRAVALIVTVPMALLGSLSAPTFWQTSVFWGVWYVYFGWAASQFYSGTRWCTWLRGAVVAAISHALIIGVLVMGSAIYEAMKKA